jgi:hypothetical protein
MCCGKPIQVFVPKGYMYKEITVKCGNTSPSGYPWQCDKCAEENKHRNWRQEALEAGEAWDEDDY